MADGAPNGYSIINFDGTKYTLDFKAAGRPADYQMEIVAPDVVLAADLAKTTIYVDLFNGSERSKVEMSVNGNDWLPLAHSIEIDPQLKASFEKEAKLLAASPKAFLSQPRPKPSTHLWKANLPAGIAPGIHLVRIRGTDVNGKLQESRRVFRVVEAVAMP
jgi:hypothetical protein